MRKHFIAAFGLGLLMTVAAAAPSFAGQWRQDYSGWWYQNDDGSYPAGTWQWIDSDGDGTAECYYFYSDGYMAHNNTIDGSYVNDDGQWVSGGKVKHKELGGSTTGRQIDYSAVYGRILDVRQAEDVSGDGVPNGQLYAGWYTLLDINNDGIRELFVGFSSRWTDHISIYTTDGATAREIGAIWEAHCSGIKAYQDGFIYEAEATKNSDEETLFFRWNGSGMGEDGFTYGFEETNITSVGYDPSKVREVAPEGEVIGSRTLLRSVR